MEVQYFNPSELIPYENNAKEHDKKQINNVAMSIKKYGFQQPIVVDKDMVIIVGHCRHLAALKLGLQEVPVVVADNLTPEEVAEFRLVDNKSNESDWLDGMLRLELPELPGLADFDFDWGLPEIEPEREITEDDYDIDEEMPEEPFSQLGDIYILGDHRLMCGDSTNEADVKALMDGDKADLVFTDPPWNVDYGGTDHPTWKQRSIMNDHMSTEAFKEFMTSAFERMGEASKDGCMTYVVMSAQEWGNLMLALAQNNYHWSSTIIWNKDQLVLSRKDYHTKYEPIWYGWKDGAPRLCPLQDRKQSDVWDFERPKRSDEHPTMKPVALVAKAIQNSSRPRDIVLDLFGGSGTTLVAAEQCGRGCRMMELDPKYVDVIVKRFLKLNGNNATRVTLLRDGSEIPWSDLTEV